jgi:23S rRNA pseudouridine1911/1915/1917 synthase
MRAARATIDPVKPSPSQISVAVTELAAGERLDRFCAAHLPQLSRTQVQALNAAGGVRVDGRARPDAYRLRPGETVAIDASLLPAARTGAPPAPQSLPVGVVYEDDAMVVVNKAAGVVVHPAHGNWDGTLVNALLGRGTALSSIGGERPGVVHRLDKDTSGLMVLAKTDAAHRALAAAIKSREFEKTYHAVVWGHVRAPRMTIDAPIARHPVHRQKMAVAARGGRPAVTEVFVVDTYNHFEYIRVTTRTGRTHQIRVHMAHVGNPLLGDSVYGSRKRAGESVDKSATLGTVVARMRRHALHASRLSFAHPETGARVAFTTALPPDMRSVLEGVYRSDRAKEVWL